MKFYVRIWKLYKDEFGFFLKMSLLYVKNVEEVG